MQRIHRILASVHRTTRLQPRSAAALGIAAVAFCCARPAHAFRTAADLPDFAGSERVVWPGSFEFDLYRRLPFPLDAVEIEDAIVSAFRTWTEPACSAFQFQYLGSHDQPAAPNDGRNTIEFVTSGWTARGYLPDAAGATDVAYESGLDGWRIAEADIYLNAEFFQWVTRNPSEGARDVLSVVTHEGGHALGLQHNCEPGGLDAAPDCNSGEYSSATMYPFNHAEQTTLDPDDVAGICFLYPAADCEGRDCTAASTCPDGQCGEHSGQESVAVPTAGPMSGGAPAGDSCTEDAACESGRCEDDGWCARACAGGSGCLREQQCVNGACEGPGKGLGEPCNSPDECLGSECVADVTRGPLCTRHCNDDCPAGWACGEASGEQVCLPIAPRGAQCAVGLMSTKRGGTGTPNLLFGVLATLMLSRVRRRTRLLQDARG